LFALILTRLYPTSLCPTSSTRTHTPNFPPQLLNFLDTECTLPPTSGRPRFFPLSAPVSPCSASASSASKSAATPAEPCVFACVGRIYMCVCVCVCVRERERERERKKETSFRGSLTLLCKCIFNFVCCVGVWVCVYMGVCACKGVCVCAHRQLLTPPHLLLSHVCLRECEHI